MMVVVVMGIIIHGVIRKILLPETTCTIVSPYLKEILRFPNDDSNKHISSCRIKGSPRPTFVDLRSAVFYIWKVGTDTWISDHYPITIEYDGTIEPGKDSIKASTLHNTD
jgi:hypothetical protein